jgi:1-phosphofructokinase family hexose kinase
LILTVTVHPALDKIIRLPRLKAAEAVRARIEMLYAGGKGNNVARALNRLGVPVIASGFQGGFTGEFVIEQMKSEGIRTDFFICRSPTRTSLMIIEEETGNQYAIYEPGQVVEENEIHQFRVHFLGLLSKCNLVLFCGSGQTSELANLFFDLILEAAKQGVRCGLDSSGIALREGVKAKPYLVKINCEELSELVQKPLSNRDSQIEAMMQLSQQGISLVALSRGGEGLLITDGNTCLEGKLRMENVVNFMGCGDSLLAGMASAILDGENLEMITRRGVACGAANTKAIGAGFIDIKLVKELEPKVNIHQIF